MSNEKRIKLDQPVPIMDKFTYQCTNCHAMLFASDNFCPCCGGNISNCLGVVVLKSNDNESEFTEEDAMKFWEEDGTDG